MFSDLKLLPSPLCYAQMRATYHGMHADEVEGLDYSSFIEVLRILAGMAFSGTSGDAAETLVAAVRQNLPPPLAQIAALLAEDRIEAKHENVSQKSNAVQAEVPVLAGVADGAIHGSDDGDGLGEVQSDWSSRRVWIRLTR